MSSKGFCSSCFSMLLTFMLLSMDVASDSLPATSDSALASSVSLATLFSLDSRSLSVLGIIKRDWPQVMSVFEDTICKVLPSIVYGFLFEMSPVLLPWEGFELYQRLKIHTTLSTLKAWFHGHRFSGKPRCSGQNCYNGTTMFSKSGNFNIVGIWGGISLPKWLELKKILKISAFLVLSTYFILKKLSFIQLQTFLYPNALSAKMSTQIPWRSWPALSYCLELHLSAL